MITPGEYPLSIVRGIEFDAVIFQAVDENVSVTGTLSPNATGLFVPCGNFATYPLFILEGSPAYFLYFNPVASSYVMAGLLTDAVLTNYWAPASPLTEPTGTYLPQGTNTGTATVANHPLDLTGYGIESVARKDTDPSSPVFINFNPAITDPPNGQFMLPGIPSATTRTLTEIGSFAWDSVLTLSGERIGIMVFGPLTVSDNITQPPT